ncbi:hypothetical protein F5Y04DRAFT_1505 [Hypomontagnella monticulosa]|nr:hypothetical protein F5Y04DRAFT_1505 [Hypomontagnella monticulosa]
MYLYPDSRLSFLQALLTAWQVILGAEPHRGCSPRLGMDLLSRQDAGFAIVPVHVLRDRSVCSRDVDFVQGLSDETDLDEQSKVQSFCAKDLLDQFLCFKHMI